MDRLSQTQMELREMDVLAVKKSPVHAFHPLCKLLVTIVYIFTVVSFPKYNLTALMVMALYPALLFQAADISVGICFYRLRVVLPLVCMVGLANPFLDHTVLITLGSITVTGGMISMATLMLKGIFSLMASFLLIATTSIDAVCAAFRMLHVPEILTTLLLLTYRYVSVMMEEVSVMTQAYMLRAPGQKGIYFSAWGSFLGQLLLRSMDRAEELYGSMVLRGFHGEFYYADMPEFGKKDVIYAVGCIGLFVFARCVNVSEVLGSLLVR